MQDLTETGEPATDCGRLGARDIADRADAIYFLMFDGWKTELRSNRWHYASRWAQHLPVVLVQPDQTGDAMTSICEDEPRIPNCHILHVRSTAPPAGGLSDILVQARQILSHMAAYRHSRPIFWLYNPDFVGASGLLPAVARIYHLTENYFDFDVVSDGFLERVKSAVAMSDIVIAVSEGVAASHTRYARDGVQVLTNGCDYAHYSRGGLDAELVEAGKEFARIAVYAGNVNLRLDFGLIERCARECPDTFFAIFGPVKGLTEEESADWERLFEATNIRYFGAVEVDRLPSIFGAADVGLIPYRQVPMFVDNLFPLKAFEMLATGLPVVSTHLKALMPHACAGLAVTQSAASFVRAVKELSRAALSDEQRFELDRLSREQDYDNKFDTVHDLVTKALARSSPPEAPASKLLGYYGGISPGSAMEETTVRNPRARMFKAVVRRIVPLPVRSAIRRILDASS